MLSRFIIITAAGMLAAGSAAAATCDATIMEQYRQCARVVDTLRPEKSGQARVFASDGSEYTAGQALWMRGQLRKVEKLCADGTASSQAEAATTLAAVQDLLRSHQRS
jgi:hypothetical protein